MIVTSRALLPTDRRMTVITETMIACFLVLRRTLNFTKAAEELYMTQQSVSQNIAKLETELRLKLFIRDTHTVRLTECGQIYGEQLHRLVHQHRTLLSDLRINYPGDSTFRIGVSDHPDFSFMSRLLRDHAEELVPGHTVEIQPLPPASILNDLQKQKLDIAFTLARYVPRPSSFVTQTVLRLNMALYVSKKHPAYNAGATYESFTHDPMVIKGELHNDRYYGSNEYITQEIASAGLSPSGFILVNDAESALSVASAGGGVLLGTMANKQTQKYNLAPMPIPGYEAVFVGVWGDHVTGTLHRDFCSKVAALCTQEFPNMKPI